MYGVLLAGGTGSRLWPLTRHANKHALPVYDKPMIFYPLKNLVKAGVKDVVVVTGGDHYEQIRHILELVHNEAHQQMILGTNERLNLRFRLQDMPAGIADALSLAQWVVRDSSVAVVLADNVFENESFLVDAVKGFSVGAHIFLKELSDDELFEKGYDGVLRAKYGMARVEGDRVVEIMEKPTRDQLPSRYAVTGAYLYDSDVFRIVHALKPSRRGELEITDVNNEYIRLGKMKYTIINGWWADAGESKDGLFRASEKVRNKMASTQKV